MSLEVFFNMDVNDFSKTDCEKYMSHLGFKVQIAPDFDIKKYRGWLPIKIEFLSCEILKGKAYVCGFGFYSAGYEFLYDYNDALNRSKEAEWCFFGLFRNKNYVPVDESEIFVYNKQVDEVLEECIYSFTMEGYSRNPLDPIVALLFASYFAENFNGAICGETTDEYFYGSVDALVKINERINCLTPEDIINLNDFVFNDCASHE
jgi:hypothetical protein